MKGKQLHVKCAETEWSCNICDITLKSTKIKAKKSLCRTLKQKQMLVPHCSQTGEETCS